MANNFLTIQMITNEALAVLKNQLEFTRFVNRNYDDSFGKTGAKIGDTLNVRKPSRYIGRDGAAISLEDSVETSVPVQLTYQSGVDIYYTSADRALRIDDFSKRFLQPMIANVANKVDQRGLQLAANSFFNTVGTPGTQLSSGDILLDAGASLDENAAPRDSNRSAVFGPRPAANMIKGLKSIFNDQRKISEQYNTGNLGSLYGFETGMDQNTVNRTVGPQGGVPLVNGAGQTGNTLVTDGWTASGLRLNQGDVFTIVGVYGVNPQSRQSTNQLQQFVVTGAVNSDGGGNATIGISPSIQPAGQFQNVTVAAGDNAVITVLGAPGTVSQQNIALHRDAITLACADLPMPDGVDMAARATDKQTGLSIRMVRQYNITNDTFPCRLDILYGWAVLYPEWGVRIQS